MYVWYIYKVLLFLSLKILSNRKELQRDRTIRNSSTQKMNAKRKMLCI